MNKISIASVACLKHIELYSESMRDRFLSREEITFIPSTNTPKCFCNASLNVGSCETYKTE